MKLFALMLALILQATVPNTGPSIALGAVSSFTYSAQVSSVASITKTSVPNSTRMNYQIQFPAGWQCDTYVSVTGPRISWGCALYSGTIPTTNIVLPSGMGVIPPGYNCTGFTNVENTSGAPTQIYFDCSH